MRKEIKNALPVQANTSLVAARGVSDESGLAQYIQTVQKIPILSAEEEYEYATKWVKTRDASAGEKLVASHLRMVVSVAYDFKNYGIPVGDLIASGNMGLMQALQKFDPEKGFRFSTYAMFWVRAEYMKQFLIIGQLLKLGHLQIKNVCSLTWRGQNVRWGLWTTICPMNKQNRLQII